MENKKCKSCGTKEKEMAVMPIAQHEKDQMRLMAIIKMLVAVILVLIILLVGSNIAWIMYENSFEDVKTVEEYQIEQDNENGNNNSIINGGDIVNGEAND